MSISNYLENAWANTIRGGGAGTSYTAPAAVYAKLHTGDPGEDGTQNAYGTTSPDTDRKAVTFGAASNGVLSLTNTPTWTNLQTAGNIQYVSLWDASSAGNCLGSGALGAQKTIAVGDDFDFTALTFTLD